MVLIKAIPWLINNPSTLIWADKIILTKGAWNDQINSGKDKFDRAINIILNILKDNKIIEILDIKSMFIEKTAENDMNAITNEFTSNVKKGDVGVPGKIIIDGYEYCRPYIASMYASMKLAESMETNCLFDERDYRYLKYKYGINNKIITNADSMNALNKILSIYIPNKLIMYNFAFMSDKKCNDSYLSEIEKNVYKMISWRQYDEIYSVKEELEKIINVKSQLKTEIDVKEVEKKFKAKQHKINNNIKRVFPVIKRWTSLTTVLATPLSIYSAASGNKSITLLTSGSLGISTAANEYIKYYENKNKYLMEVWLC